MTCEVLVFHQLSRADACFGKGGLIDGEHNVAKQVRAAAQTHAWVLDDGAAVDGALTPAVLIDVSHRLGQFAKTLGQRPLRIGLAERRMNDKVLWVELFNVTGNFTLKHRQSIHVVGLEHIHDVRAAANRKDNELTESSRHRRKRGKVK